MCAACQVPLSADQRMACIACEKRLEDASLTHMEDMDQVLQENILHETHYLIFLSLDDMSMAAAEEAQVEYGQTKRELLTTALMTLRRAIDIMDRVNNIPIPKYHHEKIIYYDRLGQLSVAVGDVAMAKEYFSKAHLMSCSCCGDHTPLTLKLRILATDTPENTEQLVEHYNRHGSTR